MIKDTAPSIAAVGTGYRLVGHMDSEGNLEHRSRTAVRRRLVAAEHIAQVVH
jgi:hypothetical protein